MLKIIPDIESKTKDEIKRFQEQLLVKHIEYLSGHSLYYQDLFRTNSISPSKIRTIEDLKLIPPTSKSDLQQRNRDFICVPAEKVIDYITTSGTLGDPVTFVMTDKDLDRLAYNEYISFLSAGSTASDTFQIMTTIDRRFMAGLAYFLGIRRLGAGLVRVGNGIPELQWDTIERIRPNACVAVPSFLLKLIDYAENHGIDYRNSSLKKAVCIGESLRKQDFSLNTLGTRIKEKWDIQLFSTYASTEMSTTFTECSEAQGGHHHPELIIAEFLDENDMPVKPGEEGELTVTTLGVEGMPLLRFRTGDICTYYDEPCKCGRTSFRISPVIGRKKQMIKYKGTTLYPGALYDILNDIDGVINYIVEVTTNEIGTDEILIRIGSRQASAGVEKKIKDHFRARLRVAPALLFEDPEKIAKDSQPEMSRKPVIFIDKR